MRFRTAGPADADALTALERAADPVALAHVLPAEEHPYPDVQVRERWAALLGDPEVVVEVVDGDGSGLVALAARDGEVLRHLAVPAQLELARALGTELASGLTVGLSSEGAAS